MLFAMAVDVLQDHDGIVHHHTDQEQQRQQGHDVEGVAEEVHDRHGAHQGHGDGCRNDHGRTEIAQEQQHHGRRQQGAGDQVLLQCVHHLENERGRIGRHHHGHAGRKLGIDFGFQAMLDLVDDRDAVAAGNLDDPQTHGGLTVVARQLPKIGQPVDDLGHHAQTDRRAVGITHHHLAQRGRIVILQIQLEQRFGVLAHHESARQQEVLALERLQEILHREAVAGQTRGLYLHPHGTLARAGNADLTDAIDVFELLAQHVVGVDVELLLGAIALQGEPQDRLGSRLQLGHDRRVGVRGKLVQNLIDLGLYFVEGHVDILFQLEVDGDHRHARRRARPDVLDARHAVDLALDDVGDAGIDHGRIGAGLDGRDGDDRNVHVGKPVHAQIAKADDAEQHQHRVEHVGQHMPADRQLRQIHVPCSCA